MRFQILSALVASVAMTASAAPSSSGLEARQSTLPPLTPGYIYARFYNAGDCGASGGTGNSYQDDEFIQQNPVPGLAGCMNLSFSTVYPATLFDVNGLTRTLRFFNKPCSALTDISGGSSTPGATNFIDIAPGVVGCRTLPIRSYVSL